MKKVVLSLLVAFFLVAIICCDGDDFPVSDIRLENFSNTGCKPVTRSSGSEGSYFELTATEGNMLYVKHVNAIFSCSSSSLGAKVEVDGNSITISEYDMTNSGGIATTCDCPYDLGYEIGPLKDGVSYSIIVITGWNKAIFDIVYSSTFTKVIVPSQADQGI